MHLAFKNVIPAIAPAPTAILVGLEINVVAGDIAPFPKFFAASCQFILSFFTFFEDFSFFTSLSDSSFTFFEGFSLLTSSSDSSSLTFFEDFSLLTSSSDSSSLTFFEDFSSFTSSSNSSFTFFEEESSSLSFSTSSSLPLNPTFKGCLGVLFIDLIFVLNVGVFRTKLFIIFSPML